MNRELSNFAARLREAISFSEGRVIRVPDFEIRNPGFEIRIGDSYNSSLRDDGFFNQFALELFGLQFRHNPAYRKICEGRGLTPEVVEHWTQIPAVPTAAFKELELSCIPAEERTAVFHSSGTTEQKPSRHYHNAESLALYETSLWPWFQENCRLPIADCRLICLTPSSEQAPHSSLVHMFETIRQKPGVSESTFVGKIAADGTWTLDFDTALATLSSQASRPKPRASLLLGTAFSFVHLLDFLSEHDLRFQLPPGSRVMETGGYKNRSRSLPKEQLHALIMERLGIPRKNIICEYGMSELSSQAYDGRAALPRGQELCGRAAARPYRVFHFPPWARAQIISPETGQEVAEGETGLIRVYDLANVFSVMAVQTEDLGIRCGDGFELIGRAPMAEPRGCSLMMNEPLAPSLSPPGGERVAGGRVRG